MLITIMTDASFCPDLKVGGYGCWVAGKRGKKSFQGMLRANVANNISAEMMAVAWGLYHGLKEGLVLSGDAVLVQTDCVPAIQGFIGGRNSITSEEKDVSKWVWEMVVKYQIDFRLKHVKEHSTSTANRHLANNICDKKAREEMQRARNLYRVNQLREKLKVD